MTEDNACPTCGSPMRLGRCLKFEQHPDKPRKKIPFIGHVVRDDPHGNKEDTRPVERRKKPNIRILWSKVQEIMGEKNG